MIRGLSEDQAPFTTFTKRHIFIDAIFAMKNQETGGRLLTLLASIIAKGKQHGHAPNRYSASKDTLDVYQCAEVKRFPEDLYQKWKKDGEFRKSDQG